MPPPTPPELELLDRPRPPAGPAALTLTLGPLVVELDGLAADDAAALLVRFGAHAAAGRAARTAALRIAVVGDERDWFLAPAGRPELVRVLLACDGSCLRCASFRVAGWIDPAIDAGRLVLARGGPFEPAERAIENYVRVAVAWAAAHRGGALVHAASAVWGGRGYLFYGESGAGKSTLAASNRRARIVSDDLSLVLPAETGLELVGSPFRGTYQDGPPVVGRFPLAAGFRLIQSPEAAVHPVPRLRGLAELLGNLPFVAELLPARPDLFARLQRAFALLPLSHLHFRPDDSYWDAIERAVQPPRSG